MGPAGAGAAALRAWLGALPYEPHDLGNRIANRAYRLDPPLQVLAPALRDDLAMTILVEAVQHDPIITGQLFEYPHRIVEQVI